MTPARRKALQWFHDRGTVRHFYAEGDDPTMRMVGAMMEDGQLEWMNRVGYSLTDKGRRMLHGDDK